MAGISLLPRTATAFTPALRRAAFHNPTLSGPVALSVALNTLGLHENTASTHASHHTSALSIPTVLRSRSSSRSTTLRDRSCFSHQAPRAAQENMDDAQARKESTTGIDEWKQRAPYRVHEPNEGFKARYDASCHCGKVKYQLSRAEPLDSKLCHCTTCQTQHAAPFQWAAIFHKEDINFSHGHHNLEWYDPTDKSIEHKVPCKVRCSYCHSPIMDEGRNMILLFPSLIHLRTDEDRSNFKPRCHMFYSQRVMDIPDGLPKWTGLNKESDLIEDSPPEQVRELERSREAEREERFKKGENKE